MALIWKLEPQFCAAKKWSAPRSKIEQMASPSRAGYKKYTGPNFCRGLYTKNALICNLSRFQRVFLGRFRLIYVHTFDWSTEPYIQLIYWAIRPVDLLFFDIGSIDLLFIHPIDLLFYQRVNWSTDFSKRKVYYVLSLFFCIIKLINIQQKYNYNILFLSFKLWNWV